MRLLCVWGLVTGLVPAAAAATQISESPACPPAVTSGADTRDLPTWTTVPITRGILAPRLVRQHKPQYTAEAMRAGIEGAVILQTLVGADGRPTEICVVRSLDPVHGLDAQAVDALRSWRFTPGMKDGVPVPVRVTVEMAFAMRQDPPAPAARSRVVEIREIA